MPVILNPPTSPKVDMPDPEKGDIVKHLKSDVEYVFYDVRERTVGDQRITYPVFLMQKPNGRLSKPLVVVGDFEVVMFVERGAPREPGERPVRPLNVPSTPGSGDINPNFQNRKKRR